MWWRRQEVVEAAGGGGGGRSNDLQLIEWMRAPQSPQRNNAPHKMLQFLSYFHYFPLSSGFF
jgi:hypothetical protein